MSNARVMLKALISEYEDRAIAVREGEVIKDEKWRKEQKKLKKKARRQKDVIERQLAITSQKSGK